MYRLYVESGTNNKKRGSLLQLIADAKRRKFDVILSKELSRHVRNGNLSYEIKDIVENNHIKFNYKATTTRVSCLSTWVEKIRNPTFIRSFKD